jgi:hypothetical protein
MLRRLGVGKAGSWQGWKLARLEVGKAGSWQGWKLARLMLCRGKEFLRCASPWNESGPGPKACSLSPEVESVIERSGLLAQYSN